MTTTPRTPSRRPSSYSPAGRLARRGFALAGGALAAALSQGAAAAGLPAPLVVSTTRAATRVAAGSAAAAVVSARVAAVTEGVLKTMLLNKLKGVTAVFLAGLALVATALAAFRALAADQPGTRPAPRQDHPIQVAQAPNPVPRAGGEI